MRYLGLGNAAPGVEFNFFTDPVAASVVFDRSRRFDTTITLLPMETIVDHPVNSVSHTRTHTCSRTFQAYNQLLKMPNLVHE